jgi:excinuclease ABC subunit C
MDDPARSTPLHPHFKITQERFPRILATRRIIDDGSEYFGPFLTRTATRIMMDFLNSTFRARTCELDLDGSFPVPCTQYFSRRCLAPCTASICGEAEYDSAIELARLFLSNDRTAFEGECGRLIAEAAERLNYERAARFRDIAQSAKEFLSNPRLNVWLTDSIDTIVLERPANAVHTVTTRGRVALGIRTVRFGPNTLEDTEMISQVLLSGYPVGVPREVRLPVSPRAIGPAALPLMKRGVRLRTYRPGDLPATVARGLQRARTSPAFEASDPRDICRELRELFGVDDAPTRIEAFDTAHISGQYMAAACVVWEDGRFTEGSVDRIETENEIAAIEQAVARRYKGATSTPPLVIVDGGRGHVSAAARALDRDGGRAPVVIGAVKPKGRHHEIARFVTAGGKQVEFNAASPAMRLLQDLRDRAHELCNRAHRELREMAHHYELAAVFPSLDEKQRKKLLWQVGSLNRIMEMDVRTLADVLGSEFEGIISQDLAGRRSGSRPTAAPIVLPIRYTDPNGRAEDLLPIPF